MILRYICQISRLLYNLLGLGLPVTSYNLRIYSFSDKWSGVEKHIFLSILQFLSHTLLLIGMYKLQTGVGVNF